MPSDPVVYIVDDDAAIRHSLEMLLHSVGHKAKSFASARQFLESFDSSASGCLVLDVRMPEMSGLDLQQMLSDQKIKIPVIIFTGHGDVPMAVRALKDGAVDFIEKPFHDQDLLDSIAKALAMSVEIQQQQSGQSKFLERVSSLSPREKEVMEVLIAGKRCKVIASELGISPKTVDVHRGHILEKMQVKSLVDLVRLSMANM